MNIKGKRSVDSLHKELGHIMWEYVGMGRTKESLETALEKIKEIRKEFWANVYVPETKTFPNVEMEKALRLADFIEIGYLMALDGLLRNESCGGHFREEYQTEDGEALRDDEHFAYVSCWKFTGDNSEPELVKEPLEYEFVKRQQRNYKS
jgi:succinate dehydrogenase / fumarate reductase flavoprotein subunit